MSARRLRPGARSGGRRRGRRGVRELHAGDEGAAARADHGRGRAGEELFAQRRLRRLPRRVDHHGAAGHAHQRRRVRLPAALGNKIIHPYSDFLLHDIGTGDGIPVLPTPEFAGTANQIRTAPLWALRTRNRLMHDGLSFTKEEAIARHAGQATASRTLRRADGAQKGCC